MAVLQERTFAGYVAAIENAAEHARSHLPVELGNFSSSLRAAYVIALGVLYFLLNMLGVKSWYLYVAVRR
jgi:hypothetical protein